MLIVNVCWYCHRAVQNIPRVKAGVCQSVTRRGLEVQELAPDAEPKEPLLVGRALALGARCVVLCWAPAGRPTGHVRWQ